MNNAAVTADVVIPAAEGGILLIRRKNPPFQGQWAMPGGFLETGMESVEACAVREAREETRLEVELDRLLGVWSKPGRDPRGHTVTAVYRTRPIPVASKPAAVAGDDAAEALWIDPGSPEFAALPIAFDHREIIEAAFPGRKGE